MEFRHLRSFQAAAAMGNFSEAAQQLGYVQSAITNQIRQLEEELGCTLFQRNGRGVTLSAAGKQLLEYANRLLALREEAVAAVQQGELGGGELRIAGYETLITYRLPPLLARFVSQYPQVRLRVQPLEVKQLKARLLAGDIDLAFLLEEPGQLPELQLQLVQREPVVVITAPEHPLAQRKAVTAADLTGETLLLTPTGCHYRHRFEHALIRAGALTGNRLEFDSLEAIKACVRLGTGVAAVSRVSVEEEAASGRVCILDWADEDLSVGFYLAWHRHRSSPQLQAMVDLVCTQALVA